MLINKSGRIVFLSSPQQIHYGVKVNVERMDSESHTYCLMTKTSAACISMLLSAEGIGIFVQQVSSFA